MPEVKVKTVTYENLPEEHKKDPKILPFRYQKPFLQEIEEMEQQKDEVRNGGIKGQLRMVMSPLELKRFYGSYLVPYGYKEDQIMRMPMKELEYLFNQVMRT
jgi:hypothetical protein